MPSNRFYRFCYYKRKQRDRELQIHFLRDGDAALEIAGILTDLGYEYGGLLLNYPGNKLRARKIDESFLRPNDMILLTTRPPLDDEWEASRRKIDRSYTSLETKIFEALRRYFQYCSRSKIMLSESLAGRLPHNLRSRRVMEFKNYSGASYLGPDRTTAFYMVSMRHCWPGGPALFCTFGMGGPETLIWTHILRSKPELRKLVGSREFVIAEMEDKQIRMPADALNFTNNWHVDVVVDLPFSKAAKA